MKRFWVLRGFDEFWKRSFSVRLSLVDAFFFWEGVFLLLVCVGFVRSLVFYELMQNLFTKQETLWPLRHDTNGNVKAEGDLLPVGCIQNGPNRRKHTQKEQENPRKGKNKDLSTRYWKWKKSERTKWRIRVQETEWKKKAKREASVSYSASIVLIFLMCAACVPWRSRAEPFSQRNRWKDGLPNLFNLIAKTFNKFKQQCKQTN